MALNGWLSMRDVYLCQTREDIIMGLKKIDTELVASRYFVIVLSFVEEGIKTEREIY